MEKQFIWHPDTGIEDLPGNWLALHVASLDQMREEWVARQSNLHLDAKRSFLERLNREWAIETGQIENLYILERGVTETLIDKGIRAANIPLGGASGRSAEDVVALIEDQEAALEGVFTFVKQERPLSTSYIKELHATMTRRQTTTDVYDQQGRKHVVEMLRGDWKKHPNYPKRNGTTFYYCPPEQTASEMERLVDMHLEHVVVNVPPDVEAAWLHHRLTQIHPFQDGNGRVARALASMVLIRGGFFPMIIPLDDKTTYIDTLERADSGDLQPLVLQIALHQQVAYRRFASAIQQ